MSNPRLALLVCDTPIPSVVSTHGEYPAIFTRLLNASLPARSKVEFELDAFDVVDKGEYPTEKALKGYRGIIITGSGMCASQVLSLM